MKKFMPVFLEVLLALVFCAAVFYLLDFCYEQYPAFRVLFEGEAPVTATLGTAEAAGTGTGSSLALAPSVAGKVSMVIFGVIALMQVGAFYLAFRVLRSLLGREESAGAKLQRLKSADVFLDLPLYIGLFGTVSSFLMMTFCPQSSRLIAYSSTLIGIIFSVTLRVLLLYPAQQKLMNHTENSRS